MSSNLTSSAQWWVWCVVFLYAVVLVSIFVGVPTYQSGAALSKIKCHYLYQFLLEWQTAIGALLGFLGLMVIEALRRGAEFRYSQESDRKEREALLTFLKQEAKQRLDELGVVIDNLEDFKNELGSGSSLKLDRLQKSNLEIRPFRRELYVLSNLYIIDNKSVEPVIKFLRNYGTVCDVQKKEVPESLTHIERGSLQLFIHSALAAKESGEVMLSNIGS